MIATAMAAIPGPQPWYFTFGNAHANAGRYVVIHGTQAQARKAMFARFGTSWCRQCDSAASAGVDRWNLTAIA